MRDCPTSREEREIAQLQQMLNLEEDQTHLSTNTQSSSAEKLMNGRDGTTSFLLLSLKIDGQINYNRLSIGQSLTREQASYVYKKIESGEIINVDNIQ